MVMMMTMTMKVRMMIAKVILTMFMIENHDRNADDGDDFL